jgi:hypothetical protein
MTISLTPEEIIKLAQQINQTIQGLQNIDAILNATSDCGFKPSEQLFSYIMARTSYMSMR